MIRMIICEIKEFLSNPNEFLMEYGFKREN